MLQAKQIAELDAAAICADAAGPQKTFFDDTRPYCRPVQAAASLDVSHRQAVSCNTHTVASCAALICLRVLAMLQDSKVSMLQSLAGYTATSASLMHSSSIALPICRMLRYSWLLCPAACWTCWTTSSKNACQSGSCFQLIHNLCNDISGIR